jgi:integrase
MSDKLALSDAIRKPARSPCETPQIQPRRPPRLARRTLRRPPSPPPRRRKAPREAPVGSAAPALPRLPHGLRQGLTDPSASGSHPERQANRRNAIAKEAREAAAPPPRVTPRPSGPNASPSLSAPRLSGRLAALAETAKAYARSAQADNTQRAYADAGAQFDSKRGPHAGVRDGANGRKPEGAALETQAPGANPPALLPSAGRLSGRLAALAETAKAYARAAQSDNTRRAYAADSRQFASWLRRQGLPETPPDPEAVGLYLASQVERRGAELSVATLERRLSGIAWRYRQLGVPLDIRDRHIATVLAGIRRRHARPPLQKAAIFADELLAMLATLEMDLRGLRDRAILAVGFAGGLRRSEIVGLDCGPRQTEDGSGWIEIFPEGALLTIRGKTGWRDVEIGRGSRADTCPVVLLETWMRLGRIGHGPLFRAIARKNGGVSGERLTDKHVVRLVQKCALAAGLRGELAEGERRLAFGGHSLRAGLASSAQIEKAHVQKHLGHASAEMTRRYQRKRDRFKINLTKAAGL